MGRMRVEGVIRDCGYFTVFFRHCHVEIKSLGSTTWMSNLGGGFGKNEREGERELKE